MTIHYLDPSAWVKRHFLESGSEAVNALFDESVTAACSRLGVVEMLAAVARKSSQVSLDQSIVKSVLDNIRADFAAFRVVAVDESIVVTACELAVRLRLRTMDALHLASALSLRELGDVVVVSADVELVAAAAREGLTVLNPAIPVV
jgi:hypothetical protein